MTERTHHYCSPSQMERARTCPGSLRMAAMAPPEPPSTDAQEGELLHSKVPPTASLDGLDDEQREQVERCRQAAQRLIDEADGDVGFSRWEQKLTLLDDSGQEISSGYVDLLIDHPRANLVTVLDWKFGREPVTDPDDNPQVQAYGIMGAQQRKRGRMRAGVFQPRIEAVPRFHVWDDLFLPLTAILGIIEGAHQKDMVLNATPDGCRYCPARTICPAVEEQKLRLEQQAIVPGITVDKLLAAYESWLILERRGSLLESMFRQAVKEGVVPGFEAKERSGGREFTDVNAAYNLLQPFFHEPKDFMPYVSASVAKIEEHVVKCLRAMAAEQGAKLTLADATERFQALVKGVVRDLPRQTVIQRVRERKQKQIA